MEEEKNNNKIIINNREYEIVSYVTIDVGNFLVYTDGKTLDNGQIQLYISRISLENEEIVFDSVSDDEVSLVIEELDRRLSNNE